MENPPLNPRPSDRTFGVRCLCTESPINSELLPLQLMLTADIIRWQIFPGYESIFHIALQSSWICVSQDYREVIVFENLIFFLNVFCPHKNKRPNVFKFLRFEERKKYRNKAVFSNSSGVMRTAPTSLYDWVVFVRRISSQMKPRK